MSLSYSNNNSMITNNPTYMFFKPHDYYTDLEKRQLFLRSYQFSRKQSFAERIKKSFFRVKRVISVRFRSARKLRRVLWLKLKNGLLFTSRRRRVFMRLHRCNNYCNYSDGGYVKGLSYDSCFW